MELTPSHGTGSKHHMHVDLVENVIPKRIMMNNEEFIGSDDIPHEYSKTRICFKKKLKDSNEATLHHK
jgi:hypothetical protein